MDDLRDLPQKTGCFNYILRGIQPGASIPLGRIVVRPVDIRGLRKLHDLWIEFLQDQSMPPGREMERHYAGLAFDHFVEATDDELDLGHGRGLIIMSYSAWIVWNKRNEPPLDFTSLRTLLFCYHWQDGEFAPVIATDHAGHPRDDRPLASLLWRLPDKAEDD